MCVGKIDKITFDKVK